MIRHCQLDPEGYRRLESERQRPVSLAEGLAHACFDTCARIGGRQRARGVATPAMAAHVLGARLKLIGDHALKAVRAARAMAIDDNDLRSARALGAAHRCIRLGGKQSSTFLIEGGAPHYLLPDLDAGNAL